MALQRCVPTIGRSAWQRRELRVTTSEPSGVTIVTIRGTVENLNGTLEVPTSRLRTRAWSRERVSSRSSLSSDQRAAERARSGPYGPLRSALEIGARPASGATGGTHRADPVPCRRSFDVDLSHPFHAFGVQPGGRRVCSQFGLFVAELGQLFEELSLPNVRRDLIWLHGETLLHFPDHGAGENRATVRSWQN